MSESATLTIPEAAFRRCVDLSTAHLSQQDMTLLNAPSKGIPRTTWHEYGAIIFGCDPNEIGQIVQTLRDRGHPEGFISLYKTVFSMPDAPLLMNFDEAGDTIDGLPTFEW